MLLKRFGPAALACALLLAACGQPAEETATDEPAAEQKKENSEETPAIPVEISAPSRGDIYAVYAGTAPIEAFAEADVIAKVGGEVAGIMGRSSAKAAEQVPDDRSRPTGEPDPDRARATMLIG